MLIDQLKSNSVHRFESHSHNSEQSQKDISQMKILVRGKAVAFVTQTDAVSVATVIAKTARRATMRELTMG